MELTVGTSRQPYSVKIECGLLRRIGTCLTALPPLRWAVVADENAAALYGRQVVTSLQEAGLAARPVTIPAGEENKTVGVYEELCRSLVRSGFTRENGIVALGGGVTGDVAGFAAATLLRGVPLVQVPTTLLAQVDSAVGGKVGVDLPEGKNLLGAFYPPRMVLVDPDVLATLPDRQFRSGVAEVIKYGMIADEKILQYLAAENPDWPHIIGSCLAIKAALVTRDEEDRGERRLLNFGHTFGHAYEAAGHYAALSHGEAVAAGMAQMLRWQCAAGVGGAEAYERLLALLERYALPSRAMCDKAAVEQYLRRDKKAQGEHIRIVTVPRIGCGELASVSVERLLEVAL